jgi:hypothetical protein
VKKRDALRAVLDAAASEAERLIDVAEQREAQGYANWAKLPRLQAAYLDRAIDKLEES